jgi:hypothetical protein
MEPLIAIIFAFFLFTRGFFAQPPEEPSVEKKLGEALIKYLDKGVKVRIEEDNSQRAAN